jgi:hypothetical protein
MSFEQLYKYGRVSQHSKKLFSKPKIWFSCRSGLNDPFECRPGFDFDGTEEQLIEYFSPKIREANPQMAPQDVLARAKDGYLQEYHKDPQELKAMQDAIIHKIEKEIGLYCLSEINDSILMWSHYADNHKGYCLEFDATENTPFGQAQEVIYKEEYPIYEHFKTSPDKFDELLFFRKYIGWKYERERRIIDTENGSGWHDYPAELLKGVIFGLKMSEPHKAKIREWVGRRGHAVQLYQAVQHDRKYAIEVKEIT